MKNYVIVDRWPCKGCEQITGGESEAAASNGCVRTQRDRNEGQSMSTSRCRLVPHASRLLATNKAAPSRRTNGRRWSQEHRRIRRSRPMYTRLVRNPSTQLFAPSSAALDADTTLIAPITSASTTSTRTSVRPTVLDGAMITNDYAGLHLRHYK